MNNSQIFLIFFFAVLVLMLIFQRYLKAYISEKGKNLATKEDIAAITTKIENIKATVQISTSVITEFEHERRRCTLSFFDSAVELTHEHLSINFGDLPADGGKAIYEYQRALNTTVSNLIKNHQKLVLMLPSSHTLLSAANDFMDAAIEADLITTRKLGPIKQTAAAEDFASQSADRTTYKLAVEESNKANKKYWEEMNPISKKCKEALSSYRVQAGKLIANHEQV